MILNSPYISGSLTVTGNTIFTGSVVISGSTTMTASYASNAELLDGLDSTVFTLTSSFNAQTASFTAFTASLNAFSASILAQTASLNAFSASILTFTGSASTRLGALESYTSSLNDKTSSFATTGSNTFIGTQTITGSVLQSGSFTSTGTLTAQTLVVQTITSSVVYSSGSNIFGNAIGNTQTFTGSVLITGSLALAGNITSNGTAVILGSGTTNYLPKFTGASTIGNSTIVNDGTTTFINTTSGSVPPSLFVLQNAGANQHIRGISLYNQSSVGDGTEYISISHLAALKGQIQVGNATVAGSLLLNPLGGNVLIGTTTDDSYKLDVNGTGRFSGALRVETASSPGINIVKDASVDNRYIRLTNSQASSKNWDFINQTNASNNELWFYESTTPIAALKLAGTTGAATFSSSVTANGGNILSSGATYGIVQVKGSGASTWQMFANPSDEMRFGRSGVGDYLTIANTGITCFAGTVCAPLFRGGSFNGTNYTTISSQGSIPASCTSTILTLSSDAVGVYIVQGNFGGQGNTAYGSTLIVVANSGAFRIVTNGSASNSCLTLSGANVQIQNVLGISLDAYASAILIGN